MLLSDATLQESLSGLSPSLSAPFFCIRDLLPGRTSLPIRYSPTRRCSTTQPMNRRVARRRSNSGTSYSRRPVAWIRWRIGCLRRIQLGIGISTRRMLSALTPRPGWSSSSMFAETSHKWRSFPPGLMRCLQQTAHRAISVKSVWTLTGPSWCSGRRSPGRM